LARRATVIERQRKAARHFLLLEAGDSWYGEGQLGQQTRGKIVVDAMNHLGYDAMTLGGLEFRLGLQELRARMEEAAFPLLSANVVSANGEETFAAPYVIKEMAGHQVAIIGLVSEDVDASIRGQTKEAYHVSDPFAAAQKYVSELSSRCDVIIVLSHLDIDQDRALAQQVPGIDVIVGGGSMKVLQPAIQEPPHNTIILQAGFRGEWIGFAKMHVNALGEVVQYENEVLLLGPDIGEDPAMTDLLAGYAEKASPLALHH